MKKLAIQIISAPSILGLKPTGVERMPAVLLKTGLAKMIDTPLRVIKVPTLNRKYSTEKHPGTNCINVLPIKNFSLKLGNIVSATVDKNNFPLVVGGDCSILIGIMQSLKARGNYGLFFLDGHADFYQPENSLTGEVADMSLAIVCGRGPELLTNINNLKPYVKDEYVIHLGQRDAALISENKSADIRSTAITCIDVDTIKQNGIEAITKNISSIVNQWDIEGCWIHFDTDVLLDAINPAVDYRIPGGLFFQEVEQLLTELLAIPKITGISVTGYNPKLDVDGTIGLQIVQTLKRVFKNQ